MQNSKNKQETIQEATDLVETTIDFLKQDLPSMSGDTFRTLY